MKTSENGIAVIKFFESLSLKAYPDPATGGEPWTIGYGHTGGVKKGDTITEDEANDMLVADLAKFERAVSRLVKVKLTQGQFDGLVSFSFNVGPGRLEKSTLLRKLNIGDYFGAASEFRRWNKAAGQVMRGLTRRRFAEERLFLGDDAKDAISKGVRSA